MDGRPRKNPTGGIFSEDGAQATLVIPISLAQGEGSLQNLSKVVDTSRKIAKPLFLELASAGKQRQSSCSRSVALLILMLSRHMLRSYCSLAMSRRSELGN